MENNFNILLGLIFFGIYLFCTIIQLHINKKASPTLIVSLTALLVYSAAFLFAIFQDLKIEFFSYSATYWFLSLSFLLLFGAVFKSISLRMLSNLSTFSHNQCNLDQILKEYVKDQSYHHRVGILLEKGWAQKNPRGQLILTSKGKKFASILSFIQKIFGIKISG